MNQLLADIRSGVRMLVKYPTLSLVAILTLGLGIGLSTTVFCVVNGGLFKGLPFPDADRVVALVSTNPSQNQPRQNVSVHDLEVFRARQTSFATLAAFGFAPLNLSDENGRPERFGGGQLTVEAFEALGVQPLLGRGFREGDDRPGAPPVILLGHDIWRNRYFSSPDIIGKAIRAGGIMRVVIGVMPDRFAFPIREMVWTPLSVDPLATPRGKGPSYHVIGRLKPGGTVAAARAQAIAIASQLEHDFPETNRGIGADVMPYAKTVLGPEVYGLLYTMLGAGIGVLLIACVNVSNLLVARASLRRREVALRIALGAARFRVVRQHLTEVLVLATAGGAIGILFSVFGMRWFTNALSVNPPPFWITFELDYRVMLFVLGLIVLASLFAGTLPALHAARVSAGAVLKDDNRSSTSAKLGKFSTILVVAELSVSCGLLIAAGLMIKSVVQLKNVRMPFAVEHVLTARVDLPRAGYPDSAASIRFFEQLLPRLRAVPGVEAATLSDGLPAAGNGSIPVQIEGKSFPRAGDYPLAREGIVTPGYFDTFQTNLVRGREFTTADVATSQPVAIVNESFARAHFPNVDPVGHQMKRVQANGEPWRTVVGVVPDLLMEGIGNNNASPIGYYIPISQSDVGNGVRIAIRTTVSSTGPGTGADPGAMTSLVRSAVVSLDPNLAIYEIETMRTVMERQTWFYNVFGTFFMSFGVCALFLAAAGLYGVMSFAVTQRTREMGVRSALGAQGRQLIVLVMRKSVIQLAIGLSLGLGLALVASGALQPVLYHVNPRDRGVFAAVVATLAIASLIASFLPARRVTKIDPVLALATE
ncbi:MAG TPA: ABC transporter permease [Vicinamibacterales bacterium]|nr:ABC transporter permease [Vicinamibacterales bacterium]